MPRTALAGLLSLLLVAGVVGGLFTGTARADSAPLDPADPTTPTTVTADGLPTVQIDGVAWSQVVVGNTVYVAGKFTTARPAGAAPGTQLTVRNNLLAYDIRTGALVTSFAPDLDGQAMVVAASPDGSRIYVGGDFTMANGQPRSRVAAYSTATGALVPDFRPSVNGRVRAIAATSSAVYLGGNFSAVGSAGRSRLAAVSPTGAVLPWAPLPGVGPTSGNRLANSDQNSKTSTDVMALVVTGGGAQVVAAGRFDTLNGVRATGVGALDPDSGANRPFAINQLITNQGVNSAVYSLSTDGTTVYGTGYDFYGPGNLEGSFAVDAAGGKVRWIGDCRGDTYSSYATRGALYMATHAHDCGNIGGWPEQEPKVFQFATAVSLAVGGKVGPYTQGNANFTGQPAPALQNWFPTLTPGTATGQSQAGWSVTGTGPYVAYAGEFTKVNGIAQQGLVRFAAPGTVPPARKPSSDALTATVVSTAPGTARVSWRESDDQDNEHLTYQVYRDGGTTPVHEVTTPSRWYDVNGLAWTDTGLSGGSHTYRIAVVDPSGLRKTGAWTAVTVAAGTSPAARSYAETVRADGAVNHWPLGERTGTTAYDRIRGEDLAVNGGVALGRAGAIARDTDTAVATNGTSTGFLSTTKPVLGPQTFSLEAWFSTTSTAGGKVIGFGNKTTGLSTNYDRHIWLDKTGRVNFGINPRNPNGLLTVTSPAAVNDGRWHHVVGTVGPQGMTLYVDGRPVAARADGTGAQWFYGIWRIGGDSPWSGDPYLNGRIDEVAVYPRPLTAAQVANHHTAGSTGTPTNVTPTASFTTSTAEFTASVDGSASSDPDGTIAAWAWKFGDGTTGTGRTATHTYAAAGTYAVTLTVTDAKGATATRTASVTVARPPANVAPTASFTSAATGLTVSVDGTGSTDPDGRVAGYAWDFGNGQAASGATASHTFAAAGEHVVRLTVTDDDGATGTVAKTVTVTAPPAPEEPGEPGAEPVPALVADAFERAVASGFGRADTGGAWSATGGTRSVSDGMGHLQVTTAGGSSAVWLNAVSVSDVAVQTGIRLDAAPTGAGTYVYLVGRRTAGGHYRGVVRFSADGTVRLGVSRVVSGAETTLRTVVLPGSYTLGSTLQVRLDLSGGGSGSTVLNAKAWAGGTAEPEGWQVSATDATAALQAPGGVGITAYVSGSATAVPVRVDVDDLWAGTAGTAPTAG
jgi:PKD repeat protein